MREINKKVHFCWLRENLNELDVDSAHINFDNLRAFAIETLLKNGFIYEYNPSCKKCLLPVINDQSDTRDFAAETLLKNGCDVILPGPEMFCELRAFAVETLQKTECKEIVADPESICESRDFAAETFKKNGTDAILTMDTLSAPNLKKNGPREFV